MGEACEVKRLASKRRYPGQIGINDEKSRRDGGWSARISSEDHGNVGRGFEETPLPRTCSR
jgi:hypothetical protein